MTWEHLELRQDGAVALLTMRRSEKRNALHAAQWRALDEAIAAVAQMSPRVLIITGEGDHFCSGMDLSPENALIGRIGGALEAGNREEIRAIILELKAVFFALHALPFPVIAAIEGVCIGGGLELALACDLRVASRSSVLAMPEAQLGMVPDLGGTVRLARLVGRARATSLILTGQRIAAPLANQWGLVDRLCDSGEALPSALAFAHELMAAAPTATAAVLPILRSVSGLGDAEAFEAETEAGVEALMSGELVEGLASFAERRSPRWRE